jgi:hypothetical protein
MVAAKLGNMSIIDLLLERGSHLDARDINGKIIKISNINNYGINSTYFF